METELEEQVIKEIQNVIQQKIKDYYFLDDITNIYYDEDQIICEDFNLDDYEIVEYEYMVGLKYILNNFNDLFDSRIRSLTFNNNIIQQFYQNNSKSCLKNIKDSFLEDIDDLLNGICNFFITKYILTLLNYIKYNNIDNYDLNTVNNYIKQELQCSISYYDFVTHINSCMKDNSNKQLIIEKLQQLEEDSKTEKQKKQERQTRRNEIKKVEKIKE